MINIIVTNICIHVPTLVTISLLLLIIPTTAISQAPSGLFPWQGTRVEDVILS